MWSVISMVIKSSFLSISIHLTTVAVYLSHNSPQRIGKTFLFIFDDVIRQQLSKHSLRSSFKSWIFRGWLPRSQPSIQASKNILRNVLRIPPACCCQELLILFSQVWLMPLSRCLLFEWRYSHNYAQKAILENAPHSKRQQIIVTNH